MNRDQEQHFDEQLRQKLSDWQPTSPPLGWDRLADALDEKPATFDALLRQKLNTSGTPLPASKGWEQLAQRMDQQASDDLLHQKLRQAAPPPYQSSSWNRLAARLELIAQRRSAIIAYKITELSMLLSALLLFWQFFPPSIQPNKHTPQPLAQNIESVAATPSLGAANEGALPAVRSAAKQTSNETRAVSAAKRSNLTRTARQEDAISLEPEARKLAKIAGAVPALRSKVLPPRQQTTTQAKQPSPEAISPLATPFPEALQERPKRPQIALLLPKQLRQRGQHHLRFSVSPWDINQIITPAFRLGDKEIARDVRFVSGRSASLMLDVQHGKHGHSYGVVYSRRSYLPTVLADAESANTLPRPSPLAPVDTNLSRITFHTISIPFQYQQQLFRKNGWQLRTNVGIEANFVLKAKFYKSPDFDNNIRNYLRQSGGSAVARSSSRRDLSASDLIHPEAGLLQGGSALLNASFYVAAGFTLERELSSRSSIFISPQLTRAVYYRRQAGLGPFGDRIHHNALQVGMRWRLDTL